MTHAELAEALRQLRVQHRALRPMDTSVRLDLAEMVLENFGQVYDALVRAEGWHSLGESMAEILGYEEHDDASLQKTLALYLSGFSEMKAENRGLMDFQDYICHRLIRPNRKLFDTHAEVLEKCLARITELEGRKPEAENE